jgi:hypothetical protein
MGKLSTPMSGGTGTTSPCLGCGVPVHRQRSLPLCRDDSRLLFADFRAQHRDLGPTEWQREYNRLHSSPAAVMAALAQARAERAVGATT